MDKLRWMRVIGDTIFAMGAVSLGGVILGLKTGWSIKSASMPPSGELAPVGK